MKKTMLILPVMLAAMFSANSASAQWAPAPSGPHKVTGSLTLMQTVPIPLPCPIDLDVTIDAAGVATVVGPFPKPLCASGPLTAVQLNGPIVITRSGSVVTLSGISVTALGGSCTGSIVGSLTLPGASITIPWGTVTGSNSPPCWMGGTLAVSGVS